MSNDWMPKQGDKILVKDKHSSEDDWNERIFVCYDKINEDCPWVVKSGRYGDVYAWECAKPLEQKEPEYKMGDVFKIPNKKRSNYYIYIETLGDMVTVFDCYFNIIDNVPISHFDSFYEYCPDKIAKAPAVLSENFFEGKDYIDQYLYRSLEDAQNKNKSEKVLKWPSRLTDWVIFDKGEE